MKFLIILCLCVSTQFLSAQKIKQIIEWGRPNLDTVAITKGVQNFDSQGNLLSFDRKQYAYSFYENKGRCKYDAQNRIIQKEIWTSHDTYDKTNYSYEDKKIVIRHESKSVIPNITFTYQYFNDKGLIVEEKIYRKEGSGKEAKLVLKEWIIKKYDAFDKLIEEKFKQAFEDSNGVKIKRVYEYDPTTQKLLKITTYAVIEFYEKEDLQRIQDITNFTYDNLGRLTSKSFSDEFYHHKYESQHYKYKAGKLWVQETWSNGGDTIIDIYKEGKLVRKKLYNSLDTKSPYWIIDYQYVYD